MDGMSSLVLYFEQPVVLGLSCSSSLQRDRLLGFSPPSGNQAMSSMFGDNWVKPKKFLCVLLWKSPLDTYVYKYHINFIHKINIIL